MDYDDIFLNKISSFGVLGYSIEKIIILTDPASPEQLRHDLETPGTPAFKAFYKGKTTGEYTIDKVLFDKATKERDIGANETIQARMSSRKIDDKIKEHFGL